MKGHIVEKMWDVTPATDERTMEDRAVFCWAESAITSLYIPTYMYLGLYSGQGTTPPNLLWTPIEFLEPNDDPARDRLIYASQ